MTSRIMGMLFRSFIHRRNFLLLSILAEPVAYGAVTIDFLATPGQMSTREKENLLYLKVKGGSLSSFRCWISSLTPDKGDPAPLEAFECKTPTQVAADSIEKITLKYSAEGRLKRGTYSATVQVLGLDQSNATVGQTLNFKMVVPAVTLKIGETDGLRIRLVRPWPFTSATAIIPIGFRVTSDVAPTQVPKAVSTELYVPDGNFKDVVPDGSLKAYFCDANPYEGQSATQRIKWYQWRPWPTEFDTAGGCPQDQGKSSVITTKDGDLGLRGKVFQLEPSVPSNLKEASAVLRLSSSEFASDLEMPVMLFVKDWWGYAAIVVFLGQLLSFWMSNWISTGRQQRLNKLDMALVESGLVNLLLTRPDLENHGDVAAINALLDKAVQANKLGEVDAAKSSVKTAHEKLDALKGIPVLLDLAIAPGPRLLMLQSGHAYVGRQLNFVIMNPDVGWADTAMYSWQWRLEEPLFGRIRRAGQKDAPAHPGQEPPWTTIFETQNLKNISNEFDKTGQYNIRVIVNEKVVGPLPFRLERDRSLGFLEGIANSDKAILLLAVVFAAILSYLAIDKLETFGSVSDYALAFLGGFGLNSTTSGFSSVLSRFKAGAPGQATGQT